MQSKKTRPAPSLGWHFDYDEEYAMACAIKASKRFMKTYGRPHNYHFTSKTACGHQSTNTQDNPTHDTDSED